MAAYRDAIYHVRLKVLDCPISPSFSLDNFVSRSPNQGCHIGRLSGKSRPKDVVRARPDERPSRLTAGGQPKRTPFGRRPKQTAQAYGPSGRPKRTAQADGPSGRLPGGRSRRTPPGGRPMRTAPAGQPVLRQSAQPPYRKTTRNIITFFSPLQGSPSSTMAPRVTPQSYFLL
jgi:hypothetical protein